MSNEEGEIQTNNCNNNSCNNINLYQQINTSNAYQERKFNQLYMIGTKVLRKWNHTYYEGIIQSYNPPYYLIRYCDGDENELTQKEVNASLKSKVKAKVKKDRKVKIKEFHTMDMHGEILGKNDSEAFGNDFPTKVQEHRSLITFQNIGPQPQYHSSDKAKSTNKAFKKCDALISMFAEVGLNEKKIEQHHTFADRLIKTKKGTFVSHEYNVNEDDYREWRLFGGTAVAASYMARLHKSHIDGHGGDKENLGRWSWFRIRGRNNVYTRFISAYRPCASIKGKQTVWTQHRNHLRNRGFYDPNPLEFFDKNLIEAITDWMQAGDNIILGIDMNDDARFSDLSRELRRAGLHDAILTQHSAHSPPSTQRENKNRTPIDAIWVSPNVSVSRSGYAGFDAKIAAESDHRLLWIEVENVSIFGKDIPAKQGGAEVNRLRADDPRCRKSYNKRVKDRYKQEKIFSFVKELEKEAKTISMEIDEINSNDLEGERRIDEGTLDRKRTRFKKRFKQLHRKTTLIKIEVEKEIRTIKAGKVPFSPKYKRIMQNIDLWKRVLKWVRGKKTSRTEITNLGKKLGFSWSNISSLPESNVLDNLKAAYKDRRKNKKLFQPWRTEFQDSKIEALAKDKKTTVDVIKKQKRREEKSVELGQKSRLITGKGIKEPILSVFVSNEDGTDRELVTQNTMAPAIAASNRERQRKSMNTDFMTFPLLGEFGFLANKENAIKVANGTYHPPEGTSEYARDFLAACKQSQTIKNLPEVRLEVTPQENKAGWRKMKEKTAAATGPLCLNFSHYKIASTDTTVNKIETFLRNIPTEFEVRPDGYERIVDLPILKRSGVKHIDGMRAIQLKHAQFNMINKTLGRRMMYRAESAKALSTEQYGSRKKRKAISCCLSKTCFLDLLRQKRRAGAIGMNDLKGNYDRIVHTVAILVLLSFGLHYESARFLMEVLQVAEHCIKTGFGVSQPLYGGYKKGEAPEMGLGQGNGNAPTIWCLISSRMMDTMRNRGHSLDVKASLSLTLLSFVCFAFVDDTDIPVIAPSSDMTGEEVAPVFQKAINDWAGIVKATGGELEPAKSCVTLIDFEWTGDKWEYRDQRMRGNFTMKDQAGTDHPLERIDPWESKQSLGIYLAADGNQLREKEECEQICIEFGKRMMSAKCDKNTAQYTYESHLMAKLSYRMAMTNFTRKEWCNIIWPAKKATLLKMGMERNFPKDVLYGAKKLNGFSFNDPYDMQGVEKIMLYLQETSNMTDTGKWTAATAEGLRLELGFNSTPAEMEWGKVSSLLTDCWYKGLIDFIHESTVFGQKIDLLEDLPQIPLLRRGDHFLMEKILQGNYSSKELNLINHIRIHLRAMSIADIATADGSRISPTAWNLTSSNNLRDNYDWPRGLPKITKEMVSLWRKVIKESFCPNQNDRGDETPRLNAQLGRWNFTEVKDHWKWFFSDSQRKLYEKREGRWYAYTQRYHSRSYRRRLFFDISTAAEVSNNIPNDLDLASTKFIRNEFIVLENWCKCEIWRDIIDRRNIYEQQYVDLIDAVEAFINSPRIMIDEASLPEDEGESLAEGIINGTAKAISDGSYYPEHRAGSSAFVIFADKFDKNPIKGRNLVTGDAEVQNAYRSELAGINGTLTMLEIIVKQFNITAGSVELALDGESALGQASDSEYLYATQSCFDILQDIRGRLKALPIQIQWRWVEGHQDRKGKKMDWWAKMNQQVDTDAKDILTRAIDSSKWKYRSPQLWYEKWAFILNGSKVTNVDRQSLLTALASSRIINYWRSHKDLPIKDHTKIQWNAAAAAIKGLPIGQQRWQAKFFCGFIGHNARLFKRKENESENCVLCNGNTKETSSHVLTCRNKKAVDYFHKQLDGLKETLDKHFTSPDLQACILEVLITYRSKLPIPPLAQAYPSVVRVAILDQHEIGWDNFMIGRWSTKWQEAQEIFLSQSNSKRSPLRWTTAIIKKLLQICWNVWDFRNAQINGTGSEKERLAHRELNNLIRQEYMAGYFELLPTDYCWFTDQTPEQLMRKDLVEKQDWLKIVHMARKDAEANCLTDPTRLYTQLLMTKFIRRFGQ